MKKYLFLMVIMFIILATPQKAHAAFLNGDEPLAGLNFYLDKCLTGKQNELPDFYLKIIEYAKDYISAYEVNDEEYEILCRITEAEATGGNIEQKMNVASCVLARVESGKWADSIKGVVFQNDGKTWQFSPVSDGRYYTVSITDSTRKAVDMIIKYGKLHDCQFFCSKKSYDKKGSWHRNSLTYVFYDGEHVYCN